MAFVSNTFDCSPFFSQAATSHLIACYGWNARHELTPPTRRPDISLNDVVFPAPLTPSRPNTIPCDLQFRSSSKKQAATCKRWRLSDQLRIEVTQHSWTNRLSLHGTRLVCGPSDATHGMSDLQFDMQQTACFCLSQPWANEFD